MAGAKRRRRLFGWVVVAGAALALSACHEGPHLAMTVTSTADVGDASPGDGVCDDGSGACTLRAAIDEANAAPDGTQADVALSGGTYLLSGPASDDANGSGDLDVTGQVHIRALDRAVIDAQGIDRVIDVHPGAVLGIEDVTVTGGASTVGGGVRTKGLFVANRSTFVGNVATGPQGGGGVAARNGGSVILGTSTITGNQGFGGAGLSTLGTGVARLSSVTVTDNDGGGLHLGAPGSTLWSSLVVDQATGASCTGTAATSNGYNVDSDATCLPVPAVGDAPGASAPLGPLADNGGLVDTHLPQPGSAAVDRVPPGPGVCNVNLVDQRAATRLKEGGCEAGAVEVSLGQPGSYTLYAKQATSEAQLVDDEGDLTHRWYLADRVQNAPYLLPGGRLLRVHAQPFFDGIGGRIEIVRWDGTVEWSYEAAGYHHDLDPMPNGNILMVGRIDLTEAEVLALGRDPALSSEGLWATEILELDPSAVGDPVVWRWSALDHFVQDHDPGLPYYGDPADHPERIDLNLDGMELTGPGEFADWLHVNGIDYNAELDQIVISARSFSELFVIDHSTTIGEAASHFGGAQGRGGDLLYRWGNPASYQRGTVGDQTLFRQHDPTWVTTGSPAQHSIVVFNNGTDRPGGDFSSVDEFIVPVAPDGSYPALGPTAPHGPSAAGWMWTAAPATSFYQPFISGSQRLADGHTLVIGGWSGEIFEVDEAGNEVFRIEPGRTVFKARRYVDFDGTEPLATSNIPAGASAVLVGQQ